MIFCMYYYSEDGILYVSDENKLTKAFFSTKNKLIILWYDTSFSETPFSL